MFRRIQYSPKPTFAFVLFLFSCIRENIILNLFEKAVCFFYNFTGRKWIHPVDLLQLLLGQEGNLVQSMIASKRQKVILSG